MYAQKTACELYGALASKGKVVGSNVGLPLASSSPLALTSGNIIVDGDFTIDSRVRLQNKNIMFTKDSKIIIPSGAVGAFTLGLANCKLFACDGLWQGIDVRRNAILGDCLIEDANTAVNASASYLGDINDESQDCYPETNSGSQAKQSTNMQQGQDIQLFPNPTEGRLSLNFPKANVATILICNILGMVMHKTDIPNDTYNLDLNLDLTAGLYQCVLQQKDGTVKVIPFIVK